MRRRCTAQGAVIFVPPPAELDATATRLQAHGVKVLASRGPHVQRAVDWITTCQRFDDAEGETTTSPARRSCGLPVVRGLW